MKFSVESWAPEYGIAVDANQLEDPSNSVDPTIEISPDDWQPITPPTDSLRPQRLLFIDGVRRIDARVWFDDGGITRAGVCASVAAGAVLCTGNSAKVNECSVVRGFFAAASTEAAPIITAYGVYDYFPCKGDTPEDLYLGIHEQMTLVETRTAADHNADLVVFDGPLRGRHDPLGVGYIKTQQVQYLPEDLQPVLARLGDGQRTPLFLIGGRGFTRYSWYLRLPGPRSQPLSGIIRCELAATGTVPAAVERASTITATLPRYASEPHKDPRAPQNLYPIAGLEHHLRHRLGDTQLLERSLRRAAFGGGNT